MPREESSSFTQMTRIEPERAMRLGAAAAVAPLWAAFFAAAGVGVTYWWMTAWTRRRVAAEPRTFASSSEPAPEAIAAPAPKKAAARLEAAPEPKLEPTPELTSEPAHEAAPAPVVAAAPEAFEAPETPQETSAGLFAGLPAEITSADPVERALETMPRPAAKPRPKAAKKPRA
jgi:hypothetical protein